MSESPQKKVKLADDNALAELKRVNQLNQHSVVVVDTGDLSQIDRFSPQDATTNPSLILIGAKIPASNAIIDDAVKYGVDHYLNSLSKGKKGKKSEENQNNIAFDFNKLSNSEQSDLLSLIIDKVCVNFGTEISKKIPGLISTEVDARLSFDEKKSVERAKRIISLYEENGVKKERILIKMASTWEGIQTVKKYISIILGYKN